MIHVVFLQERFRFVVAVDENLGQGIEDRWVLADRCTQTSSQGRMSFKRLGCSTSFTSINGEIPSDGGK